MCSVKTLNNILQQLTMGGSRTSEIEAELLTPRHKPKRHMKLYKGPRN
jgi:hypothetical protein